MSSTVPHYFFDIEDSVSIRDNTGQEYPDLDAAKVEAYQQAAVYGGDPKKLKESGVIVVTVRDGPSSVAMTVRLICQVEPA